MPPSSNKSASPSSTKSATTSASTKKTSANSATDNPSSRFACVPTTPPHHSHSGSLLPSRHCRFDDAITNPGADQINDASNSQSARLGVFFALVAYIFWGVTPLYFKALTSDYYRLLNDATVPAPEILAHRIVWSVVLLIIVLFIRKQWTELLHAVRHQRTLITLLATTALIGVNWYTFIWTIQHDRVLDSALGYYMNPLVNVFFGFIFLRERLRLKQTIALIIAATGVAVLTYASIGGQSFPWPAIFLAVSFGFYGLLRKVVAVNGIPGLAIETILLSPFALIYLLNLAQHNQSHFTTVNRSADILLIVSGFITVFPLICFANGVRRLRLATIGFIQYIAPTENFLLGVLLFGENLTPAKIIAFTLIWIALAIYSYDTIRATASKPF